MGAWDDDDGNIMVGKRRMRGMKHGERGPGLRILLVVVVLLMLGAAGVGYWWLHRPHGLAAIPNPAVIAPGGFRTSVDDDNRSITVGLEIRNNAGQPVTVTGARIVTPPGLQQSALALVPTGADNEGFTLSGEIPTSHEVVLGTGTDRSAVLVARFTVSCRAVLASAAPTDEQTFVTIKVGTQSREEELTTPVVDTDNDTGVPWLTATAQRACIDPLKSGGGPSPQAPDSTASPAG